MYRTTRQQRGSAFIVALCFLGAILAVVAVVVMMFVGANNAANGFEQRVKAEFENNKNLLAQYSQKVLEAAQVPAIMRDDLAKVAREAIQGRYGAEGSKAVFQAIHEQNPTLEPQLYVKLQTIIEAGRTEFATAQTRLIDTKRSYETALGSIPQGLLMGMAGYPKINLADYKTVTTDRTEETFKSGREQAPLQLRPQGQ